MVTMGFRSALSEPLSGVHVCGTQAGGRRTFGHDGTKTITDQMFMLSSPYHKPTTAEQMMDDETLRMVTP